MTSARVQEPPEQEGNAWSARRLKRQFAVSAVSLGIRQVLVHGSNVLGSFLLARILAPADFGLYAIAYFSITFLNTFGGTGLAANLIRQPDEPAVADYRSVFSAQLVLVLAVAALLCGVSPALASLYGLHSGGAWMFRLIALSLVVTSFAVVPQVQLERRVAFPRLARMEIAQAIAFNACAVFMAWRGAGAVSFGVAVLLRAAVGATLANLINPWPISWHWDWRRVKPHMSFALSFQGTQFISLVKDGIVPGLVGLMLGTAAVGYVNWANIVAAYPLMALMVLQRIYLPAFSRLQDQPDALARFVEQVLLITNAVTAPIAILTLALIQPITHLLFGDKWLPALGIFYFLWAANIFVPSATPLMSLLSATGRPQVGFRFALIWMLGTWLIGVPLILKIGVIGFGIANLAVQFSNLLLYRIAQRTVRFTMLPILFPTWAAAALAGCSVFLLAYKWPVERVYTLILYAAIGSICYLVLMSLIFHRRARGILNTYRRQT